MTASVERSLSHISLSCSRERLNDMILLPIKAVTVVGRDDMRFDFENVIDKSSD